MKTQSENKFFLLIMMMVSILLASMASKAESEVEVTCRAKAKEVALQTYQSCASDSRVTRLKEIRAGYKNELAEVKAKYDRMLKEMGPSAAAQSQISTANALPASAPAATPTKQPRMAKAPSRPGRSERPVSGIARKLPAKQNDNGPALPVQSAGDSDSVVTTSNMPVPDEVPSMSMDTSPQDETGF